MKPANLKVNAAESSSFDAALAPVIERYAGRRAGQLAAGVAVANTLAPIAKQAIERMRRRDAYAVTVAGTDDIYPDLHEWVLERIPERERKAMLASTVLCREEVIDSAGTETSAELHLRYDGSRVQTVKIDGHKVDVAVEREDVPSRASLPENWRQSLEKITFVARTAAGRDAVVRMLERLLAERHRESGPPTLFMPGRWGGSWVRRGDLPPRTLESVVLRNGQRERLVADMESFLADEAWYAEMSQPWHRGYLFHGPPGTGKTSVARALANHFGLPTYYLPLGDLEQDSDLIALVGDVEPRSVLLLEDVDSFHAATERTEEDKQVSVAAMLNALDGVWTPHGLITVMTTNRRESLDDALLRAGRVDVDEEFPLLDMEQAERLARQLGLDAAETLAAAFEGEAPAAMLATAVKARSTEVHA